MITRRQFVSTGLAIGALTSSPAIARLVCSDFDNQGIQQCEAGIDIGPITTALQECQSWCWAACIETIFQLNNKKVSQSRIVQRLFGSVICNTATGPQIFHTINGRWKTDDGEDFFATAKLLLDLNFGVSNPQAAAMVAQELAAGRPLINGSLGHATVLTLMKYIVDVYGRGIPQQIVVRDPWPNNQNRRELTASEVIGTFFIASVEVN